MRTHDVCMDRHDGWTCTLACPHEGDHVARGLPDLSGEEILATWPQSLELTGEELIAEHRGVQA